VVSSRARNLWLAVGGVVFAFAAAEVVVRLVMPRPDFGDVPLYAAHPHLVYTGNPKARMWHNRAGFGDRNHAIEKPEGVIRIACLGGSTTYGKGNWPGRLEGVLKAEAAAPARAAEGERFEVLNFGMAGYTTVESVINLVANVQDYAPDFLVIHHALNDVMPRLYEKVERNYGHFRKRYAGPGGVSGFLSRHSDFYAWIAYRLGVRFSLAGATMRLEGEDPKNPFRPDYLNPDSGTFRRNLVKMVVIARSAGIRPLLTTMPHSRDPEKLPRDWAIDFDVKNRGMDEHNGIVRAVARRLDVPLVDLDRDMTGNEAYFVDHVHCNVAGREEKARRVAERVLAEVRVAPSAGD
jgi:lysophospholipase L1-like esterase